MGEGEGGFERDREDRGARKREEIDTGGQWAWGWEGINYSGPISNFTLCYPLSLHTQAGHTEIIETPNQLRFDTN